MTNVGKSNAKLNRGGAKQTDQVDLNGDKKQKNNKKQKKLTGPIPRKDGKPFHKSNRAGVAYRRRFAFKLLVNGYSNADLLEFYAKRFEETGDRLWDVRQSAISKDIAFVKEKLEEFADIDMMEELGRARARLDQLYRNSLTERDNRTALAVERTRIDLFRLNEPIDQKSDDALDALINILDEKVETRKKGYKHIKLIPLEDIDEDDE
jgi:hypothetical protein